MLSTGPPTASTGVQPDVAVTKTEPSAHLLAQAVPEPKFQAPAAQRVQLTETPAGSSAQLPSNASFVSVAVGPLKPAVEQLYV